MKKLILALLTLFAMTAAFALETNLSYQHRRLPDGSNENHYTHSDGTHVKEVQHGDGSITVDAVDAEGNETITTTNIDGTVETQTFPHEKLLG